MPACEALATLLGAVIATISYANVVRGAPSLLQRSPYLSLTPYVHFNNQ